ncbi:MAG: hypothetical protein RL341_2517 [Pseudomonadota bacterium]
MVLVPKSRIDEYTARGWWGQVTLWDHFVRNVAAFGSREAVVDAPNRQDFAHGAPQRLTWQELSTAVDLFCHVLIKRQIKRDDILVVMLPNCVEQFMVYLACARLGVIVTPVPAQYREHELDHILRQTQAVAAVTFGRIGSTTHGHAAAHMFDQLRSTHASLQSVFAWGESLPDRAINLSQLMEQPLTEHGRLQVLEASTAAAVTANDVFTICWTSGTEAQPKGVPRSHNEWLIVAPSIIEAGVLAGGARLLNPFPFVNMAGLSTAFAGWLVLGGTVVQHHPFKLDVFLQQLREERIDYTVAPPAVLNKLLQNEELLEGIDFQRLSRIGSGAAPLSEWMVKGFADKYGVQIVNYFGSNEGAALSGNDIDIPNPALRAQFFPRAGVEAFNWSVSTTRKIKTRLVSVETGEDIDKAGEPGELRFSGPTVFSGYYLAPALTQRAFDEHGYYKTGDLFEIAGEQAQYYRYVGRSKDLVIRGGMNISSEEIEGLLAGCRGVREVAVVGVPDPVLGEKLCVCVAPADDHCPTLTELNAYLQDVQRVAAYKLPEYLLQVSALPRNPVGKVLKRVLRDQAKSLAPQMEVA